MLLWRRIVVGDGERVFLYRWGRFLKVLEPGQHWVWELGQGLVEARHNVTEVTYSGAAADYLVKERPDVVARQFHKVETGDTHVGVVFFDGKLTRVVAPGSRVLFWKGFRAVTAEVINVNEQPEVNRDWTPALTKLGRESLVVFASVDESKAGLLYLDNRFVRMLGPGTYAFWAVRVPRVEVIDLRRQILEVPGQEILTRDKVSLRVNIVAEYRVADPVRAATEVKSFTDLFYRQLQLAVRRTLGKRSLDEVLEEKVDVDPEAAAAVRAEMAALGVEVGSIALKDIIPPGEIREILNQVVTAEKQAQANLIRRREETAATRSLLNTARLLEENPILVRLKELETLERVTEKVGQLTVLGGFEGLITRLLPPAEPK